MSADLTDAAARARAAFEAAEPEPLADEAQTWTALREVEARLDADLRLFWSSRVPGSGAPESLMVAALQSLENKGYRLEAYGALLDAGFAALAAGDMPALHGLSGELRALMRRARPDPTHPSRATRRYDSWAAFAADARFPPDAAPLPAGPAMAERLRGGWLAQLVGAAHGTALEGFAAARLEARYGRIAGYVRPPNTFNDDINFELAFLDAVARHGRGLTSRDVGRAWLRLVPSGWSAEQVALDNLRRGVEPPESGRLDNPFDEWIGAQMRGAAPGMVAPGRWREAARLAWMDAEVSHAGNGILGEVFNAALVAGAFAEPDLRRLLDLAIGIFPPATEYAQVLGMARSAARDAAGWREAWARCDRALAGHNWIHAYPNAAIEVIALWHGRDEFDATLEILASAGHDVDCNAAQVMTVLGIRHGPAAIPERWTAPLGRRVEALLREPRDLTLDELVTRTLAAQAA